MNYELVETTSDDQFTEESVRILFEHIVTAINDHDQCIIGLSGGSTPKPIYEALGKEKVEWSKVKVFLVDERYIDPSDEDSNQKMVRDTLLKHASIPEENLIFPDTTLPLEDCMKKYHEDLHALWSDRLADVITLGIGGDGHIASLFPPVSEDALSDEHLVLHTTTDQFAVHDRITISLNAVANAQNQVFFLKGENKKHTWEEMIISPEEEHRWPAKRVLHYGAVTVVTRW